MALVFPDRLTVLIQDKNGNLITDLLDVVMTPFAHEKNDYFISGITNNGKIVFSKRQVKDEISNHWNSSLMDYKSKLEECKKTIELRLLSKEDIEKKIQAHKLWKIKQSKIDVLKITKNYLYEPKTITVRLNDPKFSKEKTVLIRTTKKISNQK